MTDEMGASAMTMMWWMAALWFVPPTVMALYVLGWGYVMYGPPNRNVWLNIAIMYATWPLHVFYLCRSYWLHRHAREQKL